MDKRMEKILQECFHPIRGKANLHKIEPDVKQAKRHLEKALNNLRAMELMFSNDLFDWTVICGYYAMYHSVLASLLKTLPHTLSYLSAILPPANAWYLSP